MKLTLTIMFALIVGVAAGQSKKSVRLKTYKFDTVTYSYCWKNIPAKAFSYINESGDLKWVAITDTDRFNQVATRCTRWTERIKHKGKWVLIGSPLDFFNGKGWFRDMDLYYLNEMPVKPIDIKLRDNWASGYTGHFESLSNPFKTN